MEQDKRRFRRRAVGCRRLVLMFCLALSLLCSFPFFLTSPELQWHIDHNIKLSVITPVPARKESDLIAFICRGRTGSRPDAVYVIHPDGSHLRKIRAHPHERYEYLSWSPDGRWMAMVVNYVYGLLPNEMYEIYRIRFDGLDSSRLTYNHVREYYPIWSSDGKSIWFFSNGNIHKTSIDGHEVSKFHNSYIHDNTLLRRPVDWSSDGQRIIAIGTYDALLHGSTPNSSHLRMLTRAGRRPSYVAWAPNDEKIMYFSLNVNSEFSKLAIFNVKENVEDLSIKMDNIWDAQWSPDGSWIAIEGQEFDGEGRYIYLLDVDAGSVSYVTMIGMDHIGSLSWSPDSEWIVFFAYPRSGGNSQIFKVKRDGTDLQQLTDMNCPITEISWSPK